MDQPGEVANPARGQLNRKNVLFPEDFVSQDAFGRAPSRVSLLILLTQAESGAYSRDSSRFTWRLRSICILLLIDWIVR